MLGAEVKLVVVKFGLEYMNVFNTSRLAGKVSLFISRAWQRSSR